MGIGGPRREGPAPFRREGEQPHSIASPTAFTTFSHFTVSSAMSLPKPSGVSTSGVPPNSAMRRFIFGSASAVLIALFRIATTSGGVPRGAETP